MRRAGPQEHRARTTGPGRAAGWRGVLAGMLCVATLASGLLVTSAAPSTAKPDIEALDIHTITVRSRRIASFKGNGEQRFGRLTFLGGLSMTSPSNYFGGFSGLEVSPDGSRLVVVSDAGFWLSAKLERQGEAPTGLTDVRVGPLRAKDGRKLAGVREVDAEGVTLVSGTLERGEVLVSFERLHRVARFSIDNGAIDGRATYLALPDYVKRFHANRGIETIAHFRSGRLAGRTIIFAEGRKDGRGHLRGWILGPKGAPEEIFLTEIDGYDVTDAATTPDGDLIVLERRFSWSDGIRMRLRLIPAQSIRANAVLVGETLFDADGGYQIDNMEGVAAHRNAAGETIVTVVSDDNFRFLQRNLLLVFRLESGNR
ncbi:MAG: hypothetical protein GC150_18045 [Rhizobiales bacterium]|nr:hypothetical protein [Hyphomicrobiales bacterium]